MDWSIAQKVQAQSTSQQLASNIEVSWTLGGRGQAQLTAPIMRPTDDSTPKS